MNRTLFISLAFLLLSIAVNSKEELPRSDEECFLYQSLFGVSMLGNVALAVDDIYSRYQLSQQIKRMEDLIKEVAVLRKENKELKEENTNLKIENKELSETVHILQEEVQSLNKKNEKLEEENKDLKNKMTEYEIKLKEKDEKIKQMDLAMKKQDIEIMYLSASNAMYGKIVELQKEIIVEKTETVEKLRVEVIKKSFEVAGLQAANALLKQTVELKEQVIIEKNKALVQKDGIINKQAIEISSGDIKVTLLNKALELKEHVIVEKDKKINQLTRFIDDLNAIIDSLLEDVANLNKEISELKITIEKLRKSLKDCGVSWIKLQILEGSTKKRIELKKVYSSDVDVCEATKFREKCSDINPGVFIATEVESGMQFGGFTKAKFDDSEEWKTDDSAFTFSLTTFSRCTINDDTHAIYAKKDHATKGINLVAFGEWDIWINDKCKVEKSGIELNKKYDCPENGFPHFYTKEAKPTLSSFEFYEVTETTIA